MKPKVFIGSSSEGHKIAQTIQVLLDKNCDVKIWSQGVFGLSEGTLESLVNSMEKFDFAILVLTPDDMVLSRGENMPAARDNVLFELGLFIGGLGRKRVYTVYEQGKGIRLPSDLAGVNSATFRMQDDGDLRSSLGACCSTIEDEIERLGVRLNEQLNRLSTATTDFEGANSKVKKLIEVIASRKIELEIIDAQFGGLMKPQHSRMIKKDLDELSALI